MSSETAANGFSKTYSNFSNFCEAIESSRRVSSIEEFVGHGSTSSTYVPVSSEALESSAYQIGINYARPNSTNQLSSTLRQIERIDSKLPSILKLKTGASSTALISNLTDPKTSNLNSHYIGTFIDAPRRTFNPSTSSKKMSSIQTKQTPSNLFSQTLSHFTNEVGVSPLSHLTSANFSTHYSQLQNRPLYAGASSQSWNSPLYNSQLMPEAVSSLTQQYLNSPLAHHNASSSRYSMSSSLLPPSYLSSNLSNDLTSNSSINEAIKTRKYTRRLATVGQTLSQIKNTAEYKIKRHRNNVAVRKSREKSKRRNRENDNRFRILSIENEKLRTTTCKLNKIVIHLKMLLIKNYGFSQETIDFEISRSLSKENLMISQIDSSLMPNFLPFSSK